MQIWTFLFAISNYLPNFYSLYQIMVSYKIWRELWPLFVISRILLYQDMLLYVDWSPILMSHNSLIISQIQHKMMKQIGISYVWHNFTFATLTAYLHFPQEQYLNVPIEESQYVSLRNFLFVNKMMQIGVSYVWHIGVTYFFLQRCNLYINNKLLCMLYVL